MTAIRALRPLRTSYKSMIIVSFLLLVCNIRFSCVEASGFPVYRASRTAPALEEDYGDPDCFEGRCMPIQNRKLDSQGMSLMMNYLHRKQDHYDIDEPIDKRNPASAAYNTDSSSGTVIFRDANPTPCSCFSDSTPIQRDLGQGVYPRYLTDWICNSTSCGNPLYRCHSLNRTILVLKMKSSTEGQGQYTTTPAPEEALVPPHLRQNWKFEGVSITVDCICQRHYAH